MFENITKVVSQFMTDHIYAEAPIMVKEPAGSSTVCELTLMPPKQFETSNGLVKTLWADAAKEIPAICTQLAASNTEKSVTVTLPAKQVEATGFELNNIRMLYASGTTVKVELTFKKALDKNRQPTYRLDKFAFIFSQPVLGACNFEIPIGTVLFNKVTPEFLSKLLSEKKIKVAKYELSNGGTFTRPMLIAFDRLEVIPNQSRFMEAVANLALLSKKYFTEKGWGVYTFNNSEKECIGEDNSRDKSEYLGDDFNKAETADGTCRSRRVGERFGRPIVEWMLQKTDLKKLYENLLKYTSDSGMALLGVVNTLLTGGAGSGGMSYSTLAAEENELGSKYLERKSGQK